MLDSDHANLTQDCHARCAVDACSLTPPVLALALTAQIYYTGGAIRLTTPHNLTYRTLLYLALVSLSSSPSPHHY